MREMRSEQRNNHPLCEFEWTDTETGMRFYVDSPAWDVPAWDVPDWDSPAWDVPAWEPGSAAAPVSAAGAPHPASMDTASKAAA